MQIASQDLRKKMKFKYKSTLKDLLTFYAISDFPVIR